ncbi:MAG: hypothetical protein U9O98_06985 [Asgard group archaeon]|nr:hypothetical protein [Asgard group archaeon]
MKTKKFQKSLESIRDKLDIEDEKRDELLRIQRQTIRTSSEAIKSVHRQEFSEADEKIKNAKKKLEIMRKLVKNTLSLKCWRGVDDAAQEVGEAIITSSIIRDDEIPSIDECELPDISYLLALCDVIGEMRRYMLDCFRKDNFTNAQRAFDYMEYIYSELMTFDYTKMLVGSLRHKIDVCRRLVQSSRSELINAIQSHELKKAMKNLEEKLPERNK